MNEIKSFGKFYKFCLFILNALKINKKLHFSSVAMIIYKQLNIFKLVWMHMDKSILECPLNYI